VSGLYAYENRVTRIAGVPSRQHDLDGDVPTNAFGDGWG